MNNKTYTPKPIDTKDINLDKEIMELAEILAKNVHENWSNERIRQGWTYGKERDGNKKTHPGLIPYEKLPEEEKTFDRNTAIETLKLIKSLGYDIIKRDKK